MEDGKITVLGCVPMVLGEFIDLSGPYALSEHDRLSEGFLVTLPTGQDWIPCDKLIQTSLDNKIEWKIPYELVIIELLVLQKKYKDSTSFIGSPQFKLLLEEDKSDLMSQYTALGEYLWFTRKLIKRNFSGE